VLFSPQVFGLSRRSCCLAVAISVSHVLIAAVFKAEATLQPRYAELAANFRPDRIA